MQSWTPGYVVPVSVIPQEERQSKDQSSDSKRTTKQASRNVGGFSLQSAEDNEDFQEHDFYGPEVYVHGPVLSLLSAIGDLFDDDKIS